MTKKQIRNEDIEIGLPEGKSWSKSKIAKVKAFVKKKSKQLRKCPYDSHACRVYHFCIKCPNK